MTLALHHYTTLGAFSCPNKHTSSAPSCSQLERLRAEKEPCPLVSSKRKIWQEVWNKEWKATACKTPRRIRDRNGREYLVGCKRAGCSECRSESNNRFFQRVRGAVQSVKPDGSTLLLNARFTQAAQSRFSALPDVTVRAAMRTALKAVRRPRKGTRKINRPAWAGCQLDWVWAAGEHENGALEGAMHYHCVLRVSALPGAELPNIDKLRDELTSYYCRALFKSVTVEALKRLAAGLAGGDYVYLETCDDATASAYYAVCKQSGDFKPGVRRHGMSRRFCPKKET